jgi:hypothetical protein
VWLPGVPFLLDRCWRDRRSPDTRFGTRLMRRITSDAYGSNHHVRCGPDSSIAGSSSESNRSNIGPSGEYMQPMTKSLRV